MLNFMQNARQEFKIEEAICDTLVDVDRRIILKCITWPRGLRSGSLTAGTLGSWV
jgi:hypothetical protein